MPGLYDSYVKPALAGLQQAAGNVGQALGLSTPDPGALDGLKRAQSRDLTRVQQAYEAMRGEVPGLQPTHVGLGALPEHIYAETDPSGNVSINPALLGGQSDAELQETMLHELTHAQQAQATPWYQKAYERLAPTARPQVPASMKGTQLDDPYYWKPDEMAAFQAEKDRMVQSRRPNQQSAMTGRKDIYLPPEPR